MTHRVERVLKAFMSNQYPAAAFTFIQLAMQMAFKLGRTQNFL